MFSSKFSGAPVKPAGCGCLFVGYLLFFFAAELMLACSFLVLLLVFVLLADGPPVVCYALREK